MVYVCNTEASSNCIYMYMYMYDNLNYWLLIKRLSYTFTVTFFSVCTVCFVDMHGDCHVFNILARVTSTCNLLGIVATIVHYMYWTNIMLYIMCALKTLGMHA